MLLPEGATRTESFEFLANSSSGGNFSIDFLSSGVRRISLLLLEVTTE